MTKARVGRPGRERFIAVRKGDLIGALLAEASLVEPADRDGFHHLCRLLGSVFHYEHYEELERLKDRYHHFNPHHRGGDTPVNDADYAAFLATLRGVLLRANFIEVDAEEIARAMRDRALFQAEVRAATDRYRDVLFFRRGQHRERLERRSWMGWRVRHVEVEVYDDVVMLATLRHEAPEPARRRRFGLPRRSGRVHRPGSMIIKCFRDIPSADLNVLLPEIRVVMAHRDRWMIGVPALLGGIPLILKLGPTLAVLAILLGMRLGTSEGISTDRLEQALIVASGFLALGGFVTHQWVKYQRQALRYQLEINGNLYFRNVTNNAGMFDAIIGAAEEQEFKEALLAYVFLLETPLDRHALDHRIETWLAARFGVDVDFELDDGVGKLARLGLVSEAGGLLHVPPLDEALRRLDRLWNGFFVFDPSSPRPVPAEPPRLSA